MFRYYIKTNNEEIIDMEIILDDENTTSIEVHEDIVEITNECINIPNHPEDLFSNIGVNQKLYYINKEIVIK